MLLTKTPHQNPLIHDEYTINKSVFKKAICCGKSEAPLDHKK